MLRAMIYDTHIPPPVTVSSILREIGPKQSVRIDAKMADAETVRSLVSRIRAEFEGKRVFVTAKEKAGIRVWRTA